ncbi:MAG TPA: PQQ-binding-like beta-propeller repeat protein [Candidatus Sumerlaeota bacterium]|nr:PQQ-binding-like beta-propeller repeat protein [Candidatus Sumerlaeota bacterium]
MQKRYVFVLLAASLILSFTGQAFSENWPQFRGNTGQGLSTEKSLPGTWSETENVLWKTPIPGAGWSSPVVWEDRIFLTSASGEKGTTCYVLCVDAKSGQILWDKEVFTQVVQRKEDRNSCATPTPATDGKNVYAVFCDGSVVALDFQGNVVWTNRDFKSYSYHGIGASPILWEGLLIMPYDVSSGEKDKALGWMKPWDQAFILALDTNTGQVRWKAKRGLSRIAHSAPCVWTDPKNGSVQLISSAGDVAQGFDLKTGERLWSSRNEGYSAVPSPAVGDGLVFTANGYGGRESTKAFRLGGKGDLQETNLAWEQKQGTPKVPSFLYVAPYLYSVDDNGLATCFKGATGEIVWQERLGGTFSASPVLVDGKVYFLSDKGETTVVAVEPQFKVGSKSVLDGKCQASIAASNGRLFIRTEKSLYCIGSK